MKIKLVIALLAIFTALTVGRAQEGGLGARANDRAPRATITVNEQFLNSFLVGIFDNLQEPSMRDQRGAQSSAKCASEIRLKREVNGVRTAVRFENGRIVGPLAFAGGITRAFLVVSVHGGPMQSHHGV